MTKQVRPAIVWFVVIGLLTAVGIWFASRFERIEKVMEIGFTGEARRNPLLAAQRFLEKNNITVKSLKTLPKANELPSEQGTLIIPTPRYGVPEKQINAWWDWVDRGGHLVLVAYDNKDFDTSFEDVLGIKNEWSGYDTDDHDKNGEYLLNASIPMANAPLTVQVLYYKMLVWNKDAQHQPELKICDKKECILLQYKWGDGLITFLHDEALFTNSNLEKHDHAALLLSLVRANQGNGTVEMVYEWVVPPLWKLIWNHGWPVVISFTIALLIFLWHIAPRLGAPMPNPSLARRSLLEHVKATGHFLWQQREYDALLDATRQSLLKKIEQTHPRWFQLEEKERWEQLAMQAKQPAEQIYHAMQTRAPQNKQDFLQLIHLLASLRKSL